MSIRELKQTEYHILKKFTYHAIFLKDSEEMPQKSILNKPQQKIYYENFGQKDDVCLVYEKNEQIVAACWVRIIAGDIKGYGNVDDKTPELAISLLKEQRNKGVGKKLILAMLTLLKDKGYAQCSLSVNKQNYAKNLFKSIGFTILKEREEDYLMVYKFTKGKNKNIQTKKGGNKLKIVDVLCVKGYSGFFFDDQKAIKSGAKSEGNTFSGEAVTEGFKTIRMPGESISVMFILEDGQIAHGDCAAVQYSGASGRDPLFLAKDFIPVIEKTVKPLLVGRELGAFKELASELDNIVYDGVVLHTAVRYGITQAALDAVAKSQNKLMAQVIAEEYGTTISNNIIPIFTQSGDDRYNNADKMILKSADVLPHALFNTIEKAGYKGEKLLDYVLWLRNRIFKVRINENYKPVIHLDVYGMLGEIFGGNNEALVDYLAKLEEAALPFKLRIEGPVDVGSLSGQIATLKHIRQIEEKRGVHVELVADEWCNTLQDVKDFTDNKAGHMAQIKAPDLGGINNSIEAVLYCKANDMGAYLGGSCNETDRSAQVSAHIAMATSPVQILAKPGMGTDEAFLIVYNEMKRILALKNRI